MRFSKHAKKTKPGWDRNAGREKDWDKGSDWGGKDWGGKDPKDKGWGGKECGWKDHAGWGKKWGWGKKCREDDSGDDAMAVSLGGEALAVGGATRAEGDVTVVGYEKPLMTVIEGAASFAASANGATEAGQISVNVALQFEALGADLLFTRTEFEHQVAEMQASAQATMNVIAIEIAGWEPPNGPISLDYALWKPSGFSLAEIKGHLANVTAVAVVEAEDAFAVTTTAAATGVGGYSVVAAQVDVGIA